nr:hypothetical protein [uncultured Dongia sp.]
MAAVYPSDGIDLVIGWLVDGTHGDVASFAPNIHASIEDDAKQPGRELGVGAPPFITLHPNLQKNLLHDVFREGGLTQQAHGEALRSVHMPCHEEPECGLIPLAHQLKQILIRHGAIGRRGAVPSGQHTTRQNSSIRGQARIEWLREGH